MNTAVAEPVADELTEQLAQKPDADESGPPATLDADAFRIPERGLVHRFAPRDSAEARVADVRAVATFAQQVGGRVAAALKKDVELQAAGLRLEAGELRQFLLAQINGAVEELRQEQSEVIRVSLLTTQSAINGAIASYDRELRALPWWRRLVGRWPAPKLISITDGVR